MNQRGTGIDQVDRFSHLCVLDARSEVLERARIRTTPAAYRRRFRVGRPRGRAILEVDPHSPWSSRLLESLGHEVMVANARWVKLIAEAHRKTDRVDAKTLARLGPVDPNLLAPIVQEGETAQRDRALPRVRKGLVRNRPTEPLG